MELVRPLVPPRDQYAEISAVKRIRDGINYALKFGEPVQIVSDAGFGKTTALYYLAKEMRGTFCLVGQAHKSVPDMYRLLLASSGVYNNANYTRDLFKTVIEYFSSLNERYPEPRRALMIVDEVQSLEATAQRELLNIQETCDLALVLSGNGERLAKSKIDRAAWQQIDSRIGMKISLPSLNRQDCIDMGTAFAVEGMDAYEAIINFGTRTNARFLGRLLREAKELATGSTGIRLHHIQGVLKAKGRLEDLHLLKPDAA